MLVANSLTYCRLFFPDYCRLFFPCLRIHLPQPHLSRSPSQWPMRISLEVCVLSQPFYRGYQHSSLGAGGHVHARFSAMLCAVFCVGLTRVARTPPSLRGRQRWHLWGTNRVSGIQGSQAEGPGGTRCCACRGSASPGCVSFAISIILRQAAFCGHARTSSLTTMPNPLYTARPLARPPPQPIHLSHACFMCRFAKRNL